MPSSSSAAPLGIPRRLVRLSWGIVGLLTVVSVVGTASSPFLLVKAPLLLVAMAPDGRHVALSAGRVDPWLLVSVAVVRRTLYSLGVFGLGAAYGELAVQWVEGKARSLGKALRLLERLFARVGAAVLVAMPLLSMCVLAGAARTRLLAFLPALVVGHCIWAGTTAWLGTRFAGSSQVVVDFFAERLIESTAVCFAIVLAHQVITRRKRAPGPPSA